ncbi:uncharacterized protein LOC127881281 [Dreissena polymorpha]|uniref:uncharacterized protein LOC127881281 n=1 Tax=Dreissena polymorpha TaxID=45954 RepID=UPI00226473E5|nr:uncharacterized protein LOC127881281 [Dreissena polymorpha]
MARKIYESRSTCSSNWKGEVMVALGSLDKKVYKLEGLGPVLSVAAYSQENWAAVERIFESHSQESFPQNLFRQLQGVQDKSRTPYLIKAIGTSGLKVAREIAEDKRKDHMKQLAVATLQMGTWEDIEETYTLSDKMLEFTGMLIY